MLLKWSVKAIGNLREFESGAYVIEEIPLKDDEKEYQVFHYGAKLGRPRPTIELAKELCNIYEGMQ